MALANSFSDLQSDLKLFEQDLDYSIQQEEDRQADIANESAPELFPERSVLEPMEEDMRRAAGEEETAHVTVRVNGIPVVLEDVPRDAWFAPYVRDIAERGIISGYCDEEGKPLGAYGPADDVTIGQLVKITVEAAGVDRTQCEGELKNESADGKWSQEYILCAEYLGWAVFSDGSVDVERPATRSEVVVTVLQAFGASFGRLTGTRFTDVTAATEFAVAIETAAADGIVSGYSDEEGNPTGEFGPLDPVNRAEVAKIMSLGLQVYGE